MIVHLLWLTLYCKSKFSSRFIKYRLTNIYLIFWNAVFKPGSFPRHFFDVVVVVESKFVGVDWGCDVHWYSISWAAGMLGCRSWSLTLAYHSHSFCCSLCCCAGRSASRLPAVSLNSWCWTDLLTRTEMWLGKISKSIWKKKGTAISSFKYISYKLWFKYIW